MMAILLVYVDIEHPYYLRMPVYSKIYILHVFQQI